LVLLKVRPGIGDGTKESRLARWVDVIPPHIGRNVMEIYAAVPKKKHYLASPAAINEQMAIEGPLALEVPPAQQRLTMENDGGELVNSSLEIVEIDAEGDVKFGGDGGETALPAVRASEQKTSSADNKYSKLDTIRRPRVEIAWRRPPLIRRKSGLPARMG
jgi:hypothetical protein